MGKNTIYEKAIESNLNKAAHALFELKAVIAFDNYIEQNSVYICGASFFEISKKALYNDMFRHAINVLEIDKAGDSVTFWYILKTDETKIKALKSYSEEKTNSLKILAEKLKHIRDKVHFHIDKDGVLDSRKIWLEADIKANELRDGLQYLFSILEELYRAVLNKPVLFHPDDYNGEDLAKLLNLANSNSLIDVVPKIEKIGEVEKANE